MRVSTAFNQLLRLDGASVRDVRFAANMITVTVALRRRRLVCPECSHATTAAYEIERADVSGWRHLDLGSWRLEVRAHLRRLVCPIHGVRVEGVPFARPGARFTRDLESLVAWPATSTDQAAIARLVRIDWATVGRICARVVADELDPARLENLFVVGVDEVSWRANHNYLTLVTNHANHKTVWGAEGKDTPPWIASSTSWAQSARRRSRRCRWTWGSPVPRACVPRAMPPRRSSATTRPMS